MNYPHVYVYGIPVSKMNMQETVQYLSEAVREGRPQHVITANPIMVMTGFRNKDYMQALHEADLVVPDGTGIVWAASYIKQPVKERVAGFDLMLEMLAVASKEQWKVYLLGAEPDVVAQTAHNIKQRYPGVELVGIRDGFFDESQDAEVVTDIQRANPHLLFVARSVETQELWIKKYKAQLHVPVMMGVGGSFDVIAGKTKRAPLIFQKLGLEWLHRLILQPSRAKRMLDLPKFVWKVIKNKEAVTAVRKNG